MLKMFKNVGMFVMKLVLLNLLKKCVMIWDNSEILKFIQQWVVYTVAKAFAIYIFSEWI